MSKKVNHVDESKIYRSESNVTVSNTEVKEKVKSIAIKVYPNSAQVPTKVTL